jgi:hypothetical protein
MNTLRKLSAFVMLAAVAVGCSDSTAPADVTLADLVGTWNATRATFDEVAGDGTFDAIPDIPGVSMSITIASSGAFTISMAVPGEAPEVETGTLTVANGVITLTPSAPLEDPYAIDILSLSGDDMTVFFDDEEWDFTDDSVDNETAATLTVVLRRQ